jgi:hypothetical protein
VPHINIRFPDELHDWTTKQATAERRPVGSWIRNLVEDFRAGKLVTLESNLWPDVKGRCPSCQRETLFLAEGGYVTCRVLGCVEPDAASTLLENAAWSEQGTSSPPSTHTSDGSQTNVNVDGGEQTQ